MKLINLINSALIVACIAFIPEIVGAQTVNTNNSSGQLNTDVNSNTLHANSTKASYLQPFNTAFLAYQGYFKEQGIPSGSALVFKYQTGNLTAKDVVQAAIKAHKLPAQVLNDPGYLNAVESQLTSLSNPSDSDY
ncbi:MULTISPECIES: hypothetical protein [Nostoc]|uniref:Uncharacterized protein n=2 Tax=Nostoc TaxID=1177 RepID=A0ABR8I3A5_9NOSO|nr:MULTISPECIES: hypothetical protein [Nostoc]MBD2559996.1 hypothetical protein [Nostoc linckia FACHB-391]MBD2645040.1 hypothetical protein [Nostoc foliaceum FACHB-393]